MPEPKANAASPRFERCKFLLQCVDCGIPITRIRVPRSLPRILRGHFIRIRCGECGGLIDGSVDGPRSLAGSFACMHSQRCESMIVAHGTPRGSRFPDSVRSRTRLSRQKQDWKEPIAFWNFDFGLAESTGPQLLPSTRRGLRNDSNPKSKIQNELLLPLDIIERK